MMFLKIVAGIAVFSVLYVCLSEYFKDKHLKSLAKYEFPSIVTGLFDREFPDIPVQQKKNAFDGLKEYFLLFLLEKQRKIKNPNLGMPSELVDSAWHCFILCGEEYEKFCKGYFGSVIHHKPDLSQKSRELNESSKFSKETINTWRAVNRHKQAMKQLGVKPMLFEADKGFSGGWIWGAAAIGAIALQSTTLLAQETQRENSSSGSGCSGSTGSGGGSCGDGGCGGGDGGGSGCGGGCGS